MSQDRREKIQDMLLERLEQVFAKYDESKDREDGIANAYALERIAQALQAIGHTSRGLTVGMYAAPAQTPPPPQEPPA